MAEYRWRRLVGATVLGGCLLVQASALWAQLRTLPANAKRAQLTGYQVPFVILGGETRRLAPGVVIFDTHNRTITPGFLPAAADVVYTVDNAGAVMRIYILTAQEQQQLDAVRR